MPKGPNVILCKLSTRYIEVAAAGGGDRIEMMVDMGGAPDEVSATRLAQAMLGVSGNRTTVAIAPTPRVGPVGFVDYGLGDTVSTEGGSGIVTAISATMDDQGRVTTVPELTDPLTLKSDQVNRQLRRMNMGSTGGLSELASAVRPRLLTNRPIVEYKLDTFSYPGKVVAGLASQPFNPPFPMQLTHVIVNMAKAPTSNIGLLMLQGSDSTGTLLCPMLVVPAKSGSAPGSLTSFTLPQGEHAVYVDATMQVVFGVFIGDGTGEGMSIQTFGSTS